MFPYSPSQYLEKVLHSHRMSHVAKLEKAHREKGRQIKEALRQQFGLYHPYHPIVSGSLAKSTAINLKFDLDIVVPFPKSHFATLQEMSSALYRYFEGDFRTAEVGHDLEVVRNQTWSVGLEFGLGGRLPQGRVNIDVVPGRELSPGAYHQDHKLLLKHRDDGPWMQTNVQKQIETIRQSPEPVRKVVRLIKVWKYHHPSALKSFLIELAAIQAFEQVGNNSPQGLGDQLSLVLRFMADHFPQDRFRLIDPGNSGNNVMDSLDPWERRGLGEQFQILFHTIRQGGAKMAEFFPRNARFIL